MKAPRIKCGASARTNGGQPCQRWALKGKKRCRLHGGLTPKKARKHGLYSTSLDEADRDSFQRHYDALQADPKSALIASAALLHANVERVMRKSVDGFYLLENSEHRESTVTNRDSESTVVYPAQSGGDVADKTIDKHTEKRIDIMLPAAEALFKAARIVANAHEIEARKKETDGGGGDQSITVILPGIADLSK